jgi:hypothetical protein
MWWPKMFSGGSLLVREIREIWMGGLLNKCGADILLICMSDEVVILPAALGGKGRRGLR